MSEHIAVLEELAKKWRSEFTGGEDRELKEIGYDACLLDCADELEAAIALMRGQSERRPAKEPEAIGEDPYLWPKKRLKFRFGDDQFVAEITIGPKGSWVNRLYQRVKSRHGHTDRRVWPAMNPSAKAKAALMHIRANERTGDIGATTGQPGEGK